MSLHRLPYSPAARCPVALHVYGGFDHLRSRPALSAASSHMPVHLDDLLLDSLMRHPCTHASSPDESLSLGSRTPHVRLIPISWRSAAVRHNAGDGTQDAAALAALLKCDAFLLDPESHVMLFAPPNVLSVWGPHASQQLRDPRLLTIQVLSTTAQGANEGNGGNARTVYVSGDINGIQNRSEIGMQMAWRALHEMKNILEPDLCREIVPAKLLRSIQQHHALVVTVCTASTAYSRGQKRSTSANACLRWFQSLRRSSYAGPVAILLGGAVPRQLAHGIPTHSNVWLIDNLESRCSRRVPSVSPLTIDRSRPRFTPPLQGNQLRLLWYASLFRQIARTGFNASGVRCSHACYTPNNHELRLILSTCSMAVLAVDARDLIFQRHPILALHQACRTLGLNECELTFAQDCKCSASSDSYFKRWSGCLPPASVNAIGPQPPVNGGIVFGTLPSMQALYMKALLLAATADSRCLTGGREQHVLTASAFALRRQFQEHVCMLPNEVQTQSFFINMGVSNTIAGVNLDERTGLIEGVRKEPIAIVHQFDRRPSVVDFLRRHMPS